jgi:hypothetical protein
VVRGRLWRATNPCLEASKRERLQHELMAARRAVKKALRDGHRSAASTARARVDKAKVALGERGPAWWTDDEKNWNRHLVKNTPYAAWYERQAARQARRTQPERTIARKPHQDGK